MNPGFETAQVAGELPRLCNELHERGHQEAKALPNSGFGSGRG